MTVQPARRMSAASTKSWLRMCPPNGGLPGRSGRPAAPVKASRRMIALWPQEVPSPRLHQAVGVEHEEVVVGATPAPTEIGDVAGLARDVAAAAAIIKRDVVAEP